MKSKIALSVFVNGGKECENVECLTLMHCALHIFLSCISEMSEFGGSDICLVRAREQDESYYYQD
jgi:hypothetical protein